MQIQIHRPHPTGGEGLPFWELTIADRRGSAVPQVLLYRALALAGPSTAARDLFGFHGPSANPAPQDSELLFSTSTLSRRFEFSRSPPFLNKIGERRNSIRGTSYTAVEGMELKSGGYGGISDDRRRFLLPDVSSSGFKLGSGKLQKRR